MFASSCKAPHPPQSPAIINLVCAPRHKALENLLALPSCSGAGLSQTVGTHAPSPAALDARPNSGKALGIPIRAYTPLELNELALPIVRAHPAEYISLVCPFECRLPLPRAPDQPGDRPDWWIQAHMPPVIHTAPCGSPATTDTPPLLQFPVAHLPSQTDNTCRGPAQATMHKNN